METRLMNATVVDWNDENLAKLETGLKAGKSASQIAKEIPGATRCAIIGKTKRLYWTTLRPTKPPPSDEKVAKKRELSRERNVRFRIRQKSRQAILKQFKAMAINNAGNYQGISLIELTNHTCRWPGDERRSDGFHGFCGEPTALDSPYCAHHLAIGTVNITRKSSDIVKILQRQGIPL